MYYYPFHENWCCVSGVIDPSGNFFNDASDDNINETHAVKPAHSHLVTNAAS